VKGSKCKVRGHEHWLREPHIGLAPTAAEMARIGRKLDRAPIPTKGRQMAGVVGAPAYVAAQRALNAEATRQLEAVKDIKVAKPRKRAKKKAKKKHG